jgi:hypothetical protein
LPLQIADRIRAASAQGYLVVDHISASAMCVTRLLLEFPQNFLISFDAALAIPEAGRTSLSCLERRRKPKNKS